MHSAWQTKCSCFEIYSSQTPNSTGTNNSKQPSINQKSPSPTRLQKESASLTNPNPHAWQLTDPNMALATGYFRSTVPALPTICSAATKVTLVGSRFTHPAESRYAPIEGEALAVTDALDKARHFVLGCKNLTIAVDHRPLLKVFGDRSLDHISNTRLRNLKERTLRYQFRMVHIPGVHDTPR